MNHTADKKKPYQFTGFHMALCFTAFFGVIITVNVFMATLASKSWTGLVVKNSYVASQKFNSELAAARAQHALGWVSRLKYQSGILQVNLEDQDGRSLKLDDPIVYFGRPAFEQQDNSYKFDTSNPLLPFVHLNLAPGLWDLQIKGTIDGNPYRRDARLLVDGSQSGKLQ